ncbi:MAG: hypothetical protein C0594_02310, partial [Marinilabiliales bacterium]
MKIKTILIILLLLRLCFQLHGQEEKYLDSLWNVIKLSKNDTTRIKTYLNIGDIYEYNMPDTALFYYEKALSLTENSSTKQGSTDPHTEKVQILLRAKTLLFIGIIYMDQGSYNKAINLFLKSLKIFEEYGNKKGMSACYNNIGIIYRNQESYEKAIEYFLKALKIFEELGDKNGMSACYTNTGLVNSDQGNFGKAIEYYLKSLKIKEERGDKKGMSACYNNIGLIYSSQENYDKAIKYFLKSLKIDQERDDKNGMAIVYGNIASVKILIADKLKEASKITSSEWRAHLDSALIYGKKAYKLAKEIGAVPMQNDASAHLQKAYTKLGKYKEAINFAEIFIETQDSMFSEEKTKALAEMQTKYKAEKKQLLIEKMEKQKELDNKTIEAQQAENHKQQVFIIFSISSLILVLGFLIIILRLFRQKRKANILLANQKTEIESQRDEIKAQRDKVQHQKEQIENLYEVAVDRKNEVEKQKKEIEDSITYAKRIQTAVLPTDTYADTILGDHFIVFRPKDVVSGDFYWATTVNDWLVVTAADCTGHGVPGAFMSMLGVSFLNEIVRKKEVTDAASVLNNLRSSVIEALKQTGEEGTQKYG